MQGFSQLFFGTAYAQGAQATSGPIGGVDIAMLMNYLPLLLIFGVFYVLIIRPQQRKMDEQARMLKSLEKGDVVMTSSGIYGKITKIDNDVDVTLEIADGVQIRLMRQFVTGIAVKANAAPQVGKK